MEKLSVDASNSRPLASPALELDQLMASAAALEAPLLTSSRHAPRYQARNWAPWTACPSASLSAPAIQRNDTESIRVLVGRPAAPTSTVSACSGWLAPI